MYLILNNSTNYTCTYFAIVIPHVLRKYFCDFRMLIPQFKVSNCRALLL